MDVARLHGPGCHEAATGLLSLMLVGALGCSPSTRPATEHGSAASSTASTPRVEVGQSTAPPAAPAVAVPVEPASKPPPWPVCQPQMFDHKPGHHDRFVFEAQDGRYGYRDAEGVTAIEPRFHFAYPFSPEGVAAAIDDQGPVFIGSDGAPLARAFRYDNGPDYFTEGRARVVVSGRVGFIDLQGRLVVKPSYDYASAFCHGRALACRGCAEEKHGEHASMVGGRWGLIDPRGREVVALRYDSVAARFDGERVSFELDGARVTFDADGKPVDEPPSADEVSGPK